MRSHVTNECTCTFVEPKCYGETLVLPPLGGGKRGRAVYLDYVEDDSVIDPACPFHGEGGSMVMVIWPTGGVG